MSELEFDGFKYRRPRMDVPDLMKELEDIREQVHRVEKPQDVKSLLEKLTSRAIDVMSHAKELEAFMQTLKEAMEAMKEVNADEMQWTDYSEFQDMVSPLQDLPMSELEQAVGRLPEKKPEFQEVLDDIGGLFGDVEEDINPLSISVDLGLPPDPNAKRSKSLMHIGDAGAGECNVPALDKDFETISQFSDEDADGLIAEFLGV